MSLPRSLRRHPGAVHAGAGLREDAGDGVRVPAARRVRDPPVGRRPEVRTDRHRHPEVHGVSCIGRSAASWKLRNSAAARSQITSIIPQVKTVS